MGLSLNPRLVAVLSVDGSADDQPLLPTFGTSPQDKALMMFRIPAIDLITLAVIGFGARVQTLRSAEGRGTRSRTPKWRGIMASYGEITSVPQSVTIRRLAGG